MRPIGRRFWAFLIKKYDNQSRHDVVNSGGVKMLHFEPNNLAYKIVDILSITGEFPTSSLYLVGKERVVKALVKKLTQFDNIRNFHTEINSKLLLLSGKGKQKTIKLYKGAIPILKWIGADKYYKCTFRNSNFPADVAHKERNFRIAESVAMCMAAGIEFRPYMLPKLQLDRRIKIVPDYPVIYLSRELKQIGQSDMKKVMFTRVTGLLFSGGVGYAVYNTRNSLMKWNGNGECKAKYYLIDIMCRNYVSQEVDSAILFGKTDEVAFTTLKENEKSRRLGLRFDGIYQHIHFIPLNEFGVRQLKIISIPNWKEKLLDELFEPEIRSYERGLFVYDALIDGAYVYSFLDSDIVRLRKFKMATEDFDSQTKAEVLCFPHQYNFLKKYLGSSVTFRLLDLSIVEEGLGIK